MESSGSLLQADVFTILIAMIEVTFNFGQGLAGVDALAGPVCLLWRNRARASRWGKSSVVFSEAQTTFFLCASDYPRGYLTNQIWFFVTELAGL